MLTRYFNKYKNIAKKLLNISIDEGYKKQETILLNLPRYLENYIDKFYTTGKLDKEFEDLFESCFGRDMDGQEKLLVNLFQEILIKSIDYKTFDNQQSDNIRKFQQLPLQHYSSTHFKILEKILLRFGLFRYACSVRDRFYAYLEMINRNAPFEKDYIKMMIETGKLYELTEVEQTSFLEMLNPQSHELLFFNDLLGQKKLHTELLNLSEQDRKFFDLVNEKTIALVGPAYTEIKKGIEIDQFDLVINLGFKGLGILPKEYAGSRVNISYYGDLNANRYLHENNSSLFLKELDFAVFKSTAGLMLTNNLSINKRCCFLNNYYINGKPNMLQIAIHDLIHFFPGKVKIFNANLFLSRKSHFENYFPDKNILERINHLNMPLIWKDGRLGTLGFSNHNPHSNHSYLKLLLTKNLIEADSELEYVLKLPAEEYLAGLEEIYMKPYLN